MAKVKFRRVVHTYDKNAKVEFCVERRFGSGPASGGLIDVSEFWSVCQETADAFCTNAEAEEVMGIVQQALADTRPVEAVPVVRGMWIFDADGGTHCSACGKSCHDITEGKPIPIDLSNMPYCPKCGAKMDGGKDDGTMY